MVRLERQSSSTAHWSQQQYEKLFVPGSRQTSEHVALVIEENLEKASGTDSPKPTEILAFLVARRVDTEWELENVVVAATNRRRGLGTRLLREFLAHARARKGSAIFLEVRESNQAARALYRKLGFEETGLRKSYYSDPPEAAILCRIRL